MKKEWQTKKLGEVLLRTETVNPVLSPNIEFEYVDVSSISNMSFTIEQTQKIKGKNAPSRARKLIKTNDVLFATIRPTLQRIAIVPKQLNNQICSTGYFVLRADKSIDHRFIYYFLFTNEFTEQMKLLQRGASYPAVTDSDVRSQNISFPPLAEQQRLVKKLDEAFAGLTRAQATAEQNLQNARGIFESQLDSIFSNPRKNWFNKKLEEIAESKLGKMLDKNKNKGILEKYLRNINVRWFEFDLSDLLQMRFLEEETEKYTAIKGDVLICEGGYPGRAAIWNENYSIHFQKAIHRVRFHVPEYNKWFLYFLYLQDKNGNLKTHFTGTGIQHFTGEALKQFEVPIAPLPEIRKFITQLDSLSAETRRLEELYRQKASALAELKQSLLHQAFSGNL